MLSGDEASTTVFLLFFFLEKKESKIQEQTIAPLRQHSTAFVHFSPAVS
jgi:hypothetical protein